MMAIVSYVIMTLTFILDIALSAHSVKLVTKMDVSLAMMTNTYIIIDATVTILF